MQMMLDAIDHLDREIKHALDIDVPLGVLHIVGSLLLEWTVCPQWNNMTLGEHDLSIARYTGGTLHSRHLHANPYALTTRTFAANSIHELCISLKLELPTVNEAEGMPHPAPTRGLHASTGAHNQLQPGAQSKVVATSPRQGETAFAVRLGVLADPHSPNFPAFLYVLELDTNTEFGKSGELALQMLLDMRNGYPQWQIVTDTGEGRGIVRQGSCACLVRPCNCHVAGLKLFMDFVCVKEASNNTASMFERAPACGVCPPCDINLKQVTELTHEEFESSYQLRWRSLSAAPQEQTTNSTSNEGSSNHELHTTGESGPNSKQTPSNSTKPVDHATQGTRKEKEQPCMSPREWKCLLIAGFLVAAWFVQHPVVPSLLAIFTGSNY